MARAAKDLTETYGGAVVVVVGDGTVEVVVVVGGAGAVVVGADEGWSKGCGDSSVPAFSGARIDGSAGDDCASFEIVEETVEDVVSAAGGSLMVVNLLRGRKASCGRRSVCRFGTTPGTRFDDFALHVQGFG